jgi:hypothetical protein
MVKSKPLEIVERVVRNMPIMGIEYLWEDTEYGRIYIAFGREPLQDKYHGVWAFTNGLATAQTVEFAKDQTRTAVIKSLFQFGRECLYQYAARPTLLRRG